MREILTEDASAWDALGLEYLQRVDRNFVTWVRHYVGPGRAADRSYSAEELRRRPLIWTFGGYSQIWLESGNFRSAARAGIEIEYLRCRHFPQTTLPVDFASHLRASAARLP